MINWTSIDPILLKYRYVTEYLQGWLCVDSSQIYRILTKFSSLFALEGGEMTKISSKWWQPNNEIKGSKIQGTTAGSLSMQLASGSLVKPQAVSCQRQIPRDQA